MYAIRSYYERHVRDTRRRRQRRRIDGESVVLAGDQHVPGVAVEDRMVRAVVAELHLQRARTAGETQQLMAEADAEGRDLPIDECADRGDRVVAGLRIA